VICAFQTVGKVGMTPEAAPEALRYLAGFGEAQPNVGGGTAA
jgi:hypothetical protein